MGWVKCSRVVDMDILPLEPCHPLKRPFFLALAYVLNGRQSLPQPLPCCR